jgi:hypothetical protein
VAARARRVVFLVLAGAIAALTVLLVRYAGGADDYYQQGDVTRWEHAQGWSGAWAFVAAVAVCATSAAWLAIAAFGRARAAVWAPVSALLAFAVAWVAINGGH